MKTLTEAAVRARLWRTALAAGASSLALGFAASAFAQETEDDLTVGAQEAEEEVEEVSDEADSALPSEDIDDQVIVTGSRIRRGTFNSIAPVQVISGEVSRDLGVVDAASILQESTAATGQQIDQTFNGFVLDNGPGSSTVSLRALGADRTLLLVNGRRLAPAGVEGSPANPDLNLLPGLLVERIELLLDGASSVYGSDAIAGVVNVILRKDFDGLEIEGFRNQTQENGGEDTTIAATWGITGDRGFAGVGVEYRKFQRVTLADRPWSAGCERHQEITEDGERRTLGKSDADNFGMSETECIRGALAGRIFINNPFGSVYYDPAGGNTGIPNFSETNDPFGVGGIDGDGDGQTDIDFRDYSLNGPDRYADLVGELQQINVFSYGEYNVGGPANITAFYEASYSNRQSDNNGGPAQLFPDVPANNPFNPCNVNNPGGVDCNEAWNGFLADPDVQAPINAAFGLPPGLLPLIVGEDPLPAQGVEPIVAVRGDRDSVQAEVQQFRMMAGFRGELPQLEIGPIKNISFETFGSYTRSNGQSIREGILEDRLVLSLQTSQRQPDGSVVCGLDINGDGIPDPGAPTEFGGTVAPDCVPVNMFAPSLYQGVVGDFATAAERDFLFGRRTFDTVYEQTVLNAFVSADLFELPYGTLRGLIGGEFRRDKIDSEPSDSAEDGTFFGFFQDAGASGRKDIHEVFGEFDIPIVRGERFFEDLSVNASARWTEEEFYGSAWTYAFKGGWRPVESLQLRGTYGTSFRAPNLRENFLRGQTGFLGINDPCVVPADAIDAFTNTYNPTLDERDPVTIANCQAAGLDPFTLGIFNGTSNPTTSVEIRSGGSFDLEPETSTSWSGGFTFEQPWTDWFDMTIAATYYSIEVRNSIAEPSAQFIVNDCYVLQPDLRSAFCSRIARGPDDRINLIDSGFININRDTVKGIDVNLVASKEFSIGDKAFEVTLDFVTAWTDERLVEIVGADGTRDVDDNVNEFGLPAWRGNYRMFVDHNDWRFTWGARWLDNVTQDPQFIDAFSDTGGIGDTCSPGECLARDVGFAPAYHVHDMSIRYSADTWTARFGIGNVFNRTPPLVDPSEVLTNGGNAPIGAGYDILGRTFFFNVNKQF